MYLVELAPRIREARLHRGLSQQALARLCGISRETINRLESGRCNDLGIKKISALLDVLGLDLRVTPKERAARPDFVRRAVISANTSYKECLYADELIQALVTGQIPPGRAPHLRIIFEELSQATRDGLIGQVAELSGQQDRVQGSAKRLRELLMEQR